jgi:hypothetical protein
MKYGEIFRIQTEVNSNLILRIYKKIKKLKLKLI